MQSGTVTVNRPTMAFKNDTFVLKCCMFLFIKGNFYGGTLFCVPLCGKSSFRVALIEVDRPIQRAQNVAPSTCVPCSGGVSR